MNAPHPYCAHQSVQPQICELLSCQSTPRHCVHTRAIAVAAPSLLEYVRQSYRTCYLYNKASLSVDRGTCTSLFIFLNLLSYSGWHKRGSCPEHSPNCRIVDYPLKKGKCRACVLPKSQTVKVVKWKYTFNMFNLGNILFLKDAKF